ncbi:nitrate- and nitrite sensing domain-containing protein [Pseudonocardia parietis]|uniref:histidine kinase n=1 Tax=Pseudonocardia parietis TaxID=570936 RepID=A0ABS4VNF8_9PSEU|nr:nitrate- and nitrite sensing domain-containing protein [Pseudonocardia parietis]MBP2365458.1 signal transduction histidine kinase [Pseudonocardia parietis]
MTTVTSTERPSTLSERLDPRNWSLVAKLAVVGLVPTVLALSIGAIRVVEQANVAEELGRGSGLVDVHRQIDTLTGALQAERDAAVTFVAGNRQGDRASVDQAQAATDTAVRDTTAQLDTAQEQEPQLATARQQAEATLGQLPEIRSQVVAGPAPATDVTGRYTTVVERALGLDRALVGRLQTADTAGLTTALGAGANAREALELERTVINGAIAAGRWDEAQRAQVTGAEASFQAAADDFRSSLLPEQAEAFGDFAAGPVNAERNSLRDQALAAPVGAALSIDPVAWNGAVDRSTQAVGSSTRAAEQAFTDGRAAAAEEAGNTAGLNSVLLMLTLLLTGGIILLLGRQMVRSLRLLRSSALEVAERKLPAAVQSMRSGQAPNALVEPVPLDSRDEIGEVARAFDAVHGQAIRLAADQAALQQNVNSMFVNLSRRSQALVERQLQLIEELESNEQDPDQLSNLFQLDHLATRMRRNSENLLVLAGTDLAKRNVAPVQVVDVLRAAVSEVEQYQRVIVQTPPSATIAGRAANDLVHLLAELLDNATNFSPPDSQVVMSTTRTADESLLIEISDRGVGMTDIELVDANQRLSGPAEVDVSASRRMGLFVVGRLSTRHRVGVRLASAAVGGGTGGLSASVTVPPHLVPSAQLPEQRRDGGAGAPMQGGPAQRGPAQGGPAQGAPAQGGPALPQRSQAAPALFTPEGPTGPEGDAPSRSAAVNGTERSGSLPSLVAGSDGPATPTFETGTTATGTGGARNGSAAALPTRTPGSALRRNAPGDAPNGQEASANGVAPGGLQAFAPSRDGADPDDRTPADVFTPADDTGSTGTGADGPGTGGDARGTGGSAQGPDAFRARPGTSGPDTSGPGGDDTGEPDHTGESDHTGEAEETGEAGPDAPEDSDGPAPATTGAIGGIAAALGLARSGTDRQGSSADREMDDTVVMGAAVDDDPSTGDEPARADLTTGTDAGADPRSPEDALSPGTAQDPDSARTADGARTTDEARTAGSSRTPADAQAATGTRTGESPRAGEDTQAADGTDRTARTDDTARTDGTARTDSTTGPDSTDGTDGTASTDGATTAGPADRRPGEGGPADRPDTTATDAAPQTDRTASADSTGPAGRMGAVAPAAADTAAGTSGTDTAAADDKHEDKAADKAGTTATAAAAAAAAGTAALAGATAAGSTADRTGSDETDAAPDDTDAAAAAEPGRTGINGTGTTGTGATGFGVVRTGAVGTGTARTDAARTDTPWADTARTGSDRTGSDEAGETGVPEVNGETGEITRIGAETDSAPDPGTDDASDSPAPGGSTTDTADAGTESTDTTTAAFPSIRPSGREPMGGPPRANGTRPGPAPRPVMPGGQGPSRGPAPLPTRRPGTGSQEPGLPQRAPGGALGQPPSPGPNGAPAPNGTPAPNGSPAPLPKRQVPVRGAAGRPAQAAAPGQSQEELFAPKVPVEGDRGQLRRPGGLESARAQDDFDMGQTTPIFDDIASAWFRSNRSVPVRWQDGRPAQAAGPAAPEQGASEASASSVSTTEDGARDQGFASPADEVWRQAREAAGDDAGSVRPDETTQAGLPKRRPRARLLPGSAAGSTVLSPPPTGEPRDAETVRGRLASYQQGVRQGRESAAGRQRTSRTTMDGTPEPSDRPNSSHPEENQ